MMMKLPSPKTLVHTP